jgi:hypothetical protein
MCRPEQVRDEIDDGRVLRERPQLGMLVHGLAQPPDVRLLGRVIRRQIELIVGGRERSRLLDLRVHDGAEPAEPRAADVTRHGEETVREISRPGRRIEHERRVLQNAFRRHSLSSSYSPRQPISSCSSVMSTSRSL